MCVYISDNMPFIHQNNDERAHYYEIKTLPDVTCLSLNDANSTNKQLLVKMKDKYCGSDFSLSTTYTWLKKILTCSEFLIDIKTDRSDGFSFCVTPTAEFMLVETYYFDEK